MKRGVSLLLLLVGSVAAGLWLSLPTPVTAPPTTGSCEQGEVCSTAPATEDQSPAAEAQPPASEPPAAPAPPPAPPPDGNALREQADRLIAEGHVEEGIQRMREATEADPSARNHGDLGALLQRLTAFDEAARHLRRAAEIDPGNADRWIALANAYYLAVNPGEAWKAERRAREAEPGLVLGRGPDGLRVRKKDDSAAGKQ